MQSAPVDSPHRVRPVLAAQRMFFVGTPALVVMGSDLLSKSSVEQALIAGQVVPVVGDLLRLTLGYNSGIAFGVLRGTGDPLLVLTGATLTLLSIWISVLIIRPTRAPVPFAPLGLILGGAAANFTDRVVDGRVTDFIDAGVGLSRWPAFNLADTAIVLGITALLFASAFSARRGTTTGSTLKR